MRRWHRSTALGVALCASAALPPLRAQAPAAVDAGALASWIGLDAPTGREGDALRIVQQTLPGWSRDSLGNLVMRKGRGHPRRLVACAIDQPAFVVSEITDDGYLRLNPAGNWRRSPFWDQSFEGQRVRVLSHGGWLAAATAVRSTHLWRGRSPSDAPATVDELWVDVGARSRAEVQALGIRLLDGVVRDWPLWRIAGATSGPSAASRAGCLSVAAAAAWAAPTRGETIFALTVQSGFQWAGLGAVVSGVGDVDTLVIAAPPVGRPDSIRPAIGDSTGAAVARSAAAPYVRAASRAGAIVVLSPRASYVGTLVETVRDVDLSAYSAAVARAAGVAEPRSLPIVPSRQPNDALIHDSLTDAATVISALTRVYAVSGFEAPMRAAVTAMLPPWAKSASRVDSAGNIIVEAGPDRDTVAIVAHMDEIGFTVASIASDGSVTLANRGGFFRSLWESQPALLHFAKGEPLPGIFLPRASGTTKQPPETHAWFGLDSAALVARGVVIGLPVTGEKSPTRLAATRFTARSIDDRAGCTALLLALRAIDPKRLPRKVYFVFSTREEIGLEGAAAFAADHPRGIRRVYAVDTFVSSDSPLENQRFAYAPLGGGAVARALDNSSATPPDELARLVRIVGAAGIPFQVGTTNGGNDGSEFVRYGTVDVAVAWPLRYAHSPAELIDLGDLAALGRVVAALAMAQ